MKYLKLIKKIVLWLLLLVIVLIWWSTAYQQFFVTDEKTVSKFAESFAEVEMKYTTIQWRKIRYLDVWPKDGALVFMIHGAPGSLTGERRILEDKRLHEGYRFILVDRPGYWWSGAWKSIKSIKTHSDILMELLEEIWIDETNKPMVVGHSYGATIALKMTMDHSDKLSSAIVVSWAVDPDHERVFAISHLIKRQPFKFLSWPLFRVANDEKLAHVESLRNEVQNYEDIAIPVTVIHGTSDSIVPFENYTYMQSKIPDPRWIFISLEGKDHALHMTDPVVFVDAILNSK